jgi:hypothetical protein
MKGIDWDNLTLNGVALADVLDQPQIPSWDQIEAMRGIEFSDGTVRPAIFILPKLPQLGDKHPRDSGYFVIAYGSKWEDREWAKGWVTYSNGEHENTEDFWIPKDPPRGLIANIVIDE